MFIICLLWFRLHLSLYKVDLERWSSYQP